jgi:fumarate hydratase subunit beta
MVIKVSLPLSEETIENLEAGNNVFLSGVIYVARDAAHRRMVEALDEGEPLPFDIRGQTIYYMGPTPAKPGRVIGSAGPTTSGRMDIYSVRLITEGLKGMVGKGQRSPAVKEAIKKYKAIYFAAIGGTGALLSRSIKKSEVIAYNELEVEAVRRLEVDNFPVIVINDIYGGDLYRDGKARYRIGWERSES